ncbi:MAG TPA: hypothetical protein VK335_05325, partial [Bryobacteraceae bacterium]|nr:hypothetical protein [Bryobacteraceae bacterium]
MNNLGRSASSKVAWRLIPFLILCYFIAFLDRVNAACAALTMNKELGSTAEMFGLGVGIFFIGYFIFEIPSNLVLERVGAVSSGRTRLAGSRMPPGSSTLGLVGLATQPSSGRRRSSWSPAMPLRTPESATRAMRAAGRVATVTEWTEASPLHAARGEHCMGVSRLQHAVRALLGIYISSWTLLPAVAQPKDLVDQDLKPREIVRCASTDATIPSGIAVVLPSGEKGYKSGNLEALNNPFVSGVAVQINWRDIEPVQGKPDWSKLDALFAAAISSKKWVQLDIFAGFFSPEWALEGAKTDLFPIPYGPGHGTVTRLPMPWDRVYLDRWFAFLKQLGKRYGTSPAFRMIAAGGPTSVSEEMTLPNGPPAIRKWLSDGYTPAKYLGAWEETFHVYADTFPNQCVSLAAPQLPILEQGRRDPPAHLRSKHEVVDRAMRVFGRRLAIQSNDLHAGRAQVEAPDGTDFINSYSGRIITGFEMRGGSQGPVPSKVMGAEGNPPLA